jgi:hypothetical protein
VKLTEAGVAPRRRTPYACRSRRRGHRSKPRRRWRAGHSSDWLQRGFRAQTERRVCAHPLDARDLGHPPPRRSYPSQFRPLAYGCRCLPISALNDPLVTQLVWRSENESAALAGFVALAAGVFAAGGPLRRRPTEGLRLHVPLRGDAKFLPGSVSQGRTSPYRDCMTEIQAATAETRKEKWE